MTARRTAVRCEDLHVSYGAVSALRGVDVDVKQGQLTVVIGPNGAGKTTLLRTICGLERPASGTVTVDGERTDMLGPERLLEHGVALVPEGRHVFPHLTVTDNLRLGAFSKRRDRETVKRRMAQAYGWFPLLEPYGDHLAGTLSGGEQQMLAIARALMSEPQVLCLDEPSLGLAPKVVRGVLDMLAAMRDRGVTILLVEQFAYLALQVADRAYLLENGSIVRSGAAKKLLADDHVRASYLGASGNALVKG